MAFSRPRRLLASTIGVVLLIPYSSIGCDDPPDTEEVPGVSRSEAESRVERLRRRVRAQHGDVSRSIASHAPEVGVPDAPDTGGASE